MTNILTHDTTSLFRSWQMSSAKLVLIIEGDTDVAFYSGICETFLDPDSYILIQARRLPGSTGGGKQKALTFMESVINDFGLINSFFGKKTGIMFFLDKDIDEIIGLKIKSPHVVYTTNYDFESHVIENSKFTRALSIICKIPERTLKTHIGDHRAWMRSAAENWFDWITLCIYCQKHEIKAEPNYSCYSRVNERTIGAFNSTDFKNVSKRIITKHNIKTTDFEHEIEKIRNLVKALYAEDKHNTVFKGKWYQAFLEDLIETLTGRRPENEAYEKFLCSAMTSLDFNEPWTKSFKAPVIALQAKL